MPNILTGTFPKSLTVNGEDYAIVWDHRSCLRIMAALESGDLTRWEQYLYLVQALYEDVPPDFNAALMQALWFLHGGRELEEASAKADTRRTFSYEQDAELIYSAFSTRHGIDLAVTDLHWWRFRALFTDLRETTFSELCSMRKRYYDGDCNPKELEAIAEMGDSFHLAGEGDEELTWQEHQNILAFEAAERARHNG
jgi:hypothetical protein